METVYRDYAPKGVKFFYIYKALAHPETNGYVQPVSLEERLLHIREAKAKLGSQVPWLCDTMKNDVLHALGNAPNSEFIIDREGKVVVRRVWSRPQELRSDLAKLVGEVDPATTVEDLKMRPYSRRGESGVAGVKKLELPPDLRPLQVTTTLTTDPYYVKLRAEAERSVLSGKSGTIYLGFRLDPLYHVHWNNLAGRFEYEVRNAKGVTVEPSKGTGPQIEAETDGAPREFLLEVESSGSDPLTGFDVVVRYFACHDTEGWCKPFTHTYHVRLEADRDGGRVMRRGGRAMRAGGGPAGPNGRKRPPFAGRNRTMGVVKQVELESGKLTLRLRGGGEATFTVDGETIVMRRGPMRPRPSSLKDVKSGDRVMLQAAERKDNQPKRVVRMMVMPGR